MAIKQTRSKTKTRKKARPQSFSPDVYKVLREQFNSLDKDGSGQIDSEEASILAAQYLSPEASFAEQEKLGESLRSALDSDRDGKISFEEYSSRFGIKLQLQEARKRRNLGKRTYIQSRMAKPGSNYRANSEQIVFIFGVVVVFSVVYHVLM
jgi:Ca2+-binding EF-hand superfamily protein